MEKPLQEALNDKEWYLQARTRDHRYAAITLWTCFSQHGSIGNKDAILTLSPFLTVVGFETCMIVSFFQTLLRVTAAHNELPRLVSECSEHLTIDGEGVIEQSELSLVRWCAERLIASKTLSVDGQMTRSAIERKLSLYQENRGCLFLLEQFARLSIPEEDQSGLFEAIGLYIKKSPPLRGHSESQLRKILKLQFPQLPLSSLNESDKPLDMSPF